MFENEKMANVTKQINVILWCPYLATSNAPINIEMEWWAGLLVMWL